MPSFADAPATGERPPQHEPAWTTVKIFVDHPLDPQISSSCLGSLVDYRPEWTDPLPPERFRTAKAGRSRVWLTHKRPEDPPPGLPVVVRQGSALASKLELDLEALGTAERLLMEMDTAERLAAKGVFPESPVTVEGARVALVGAGIVNLVTALSLAEKGADIEVFEAGPDPRSKTRRQELGATHGGADARMFCSTEADNYQRKAEREIFGTRITEGGWLVSRPGDLSARERRWIDEFLSLPRWQAEVFTRDIHRFNTAGGKLWDRLRIEQPALFDDVAYTPGVLRIYARREQVKAAERLHRGLGSLQRTLDRNELGRDYPGLAAAIADDGIAGGLEIRGFTVGIHRLVKKLLGQLESRGVRFHWNRPVRGLARNGSTGAVVGLDTDHGRVRADHYVLSPGARCGELLAGAESDGRIQGVLGLWLVLPHVKPHLARSVKLHREGRVGEDSNIVLGSDGAGRPVLILGSGYGFLGERNPDLSSPQVRHLFRALEETARRYLPTAYEKACRDPGLNGPLTACVRPFTSTGLGVFEILPAAGGGRLVITGGHNTGGFTQAPVVAEAVCATLAGESHPMQSLYRPDRGCDGVGDERTAAVL